MSAETVFRAKAPIFMRRLMADFPIGEEGAAAIMGNLGHESDGLTVFHERGQPAGLGGYGWAQWTGPRRQDFFRWINRNRHRGWTLEHDEANYSFLYRELKGYEGEPAGVAIAAVRRAHGLQSKTIAFEKAFERAGVKHYASRIRWAKIALEAFQGAPWMPDPSPTEMERPSWLQLAFNWFLRLFRRTT